MSRNEIRRSGQVQALLNRPHIHDREAAVVHDRFQLALCPKGKGTTDSPFSLGTQMAANCLRQRRWVRVPLNPAPDCEGKPSPWNQDPTNLTQSGYRVREEL